MTQNTGSTEVDRPKGGEKAILVHINFPKEDMQEDLAELSELAISAEVQILEVMTASRQMPEPKYFVGTGKAEEIRQAVLLHQADVVIFNHALSPAQERNLEQLFKCQVIDRTGIILNIFAQRARSFEGKLQVELALLNHLATRLVGGWTHLERQRGGMKLRGPGETQLETDRRLLRERIKFIEARLMKVKKQREQGRRSRKRASVPTVALVGYTNAGKSTLFNRLTGADVYAANRLFATLDPTLRRVELPEVGPVVLADTVGFIRHLPHDLIEAFHATLEEVAEADLLLHVVDAYDPKKQANVEQVAAVLNQIGAEKVPQILVYNKIDLCPELSPGTDKDAEGSVRRAWVSAEQNIGLTELVTAIKSLLSKEIVQHQLTLPPDQAKKRAKLYRLAAVVSETVDEEGNYHLLVRMPRLDWEQFDRKA